VKIIPPRLEQGDGIGIIAPAGPIADPELQPGADLLTSLGFKVFLSSHVLGKKDYLAGDDRVRLRDLHDMFRDDKIKAILCARGGYGTLRLLESIDYEIIRENPKILVGYSDITALLVALHKRTGLVTFHGPMLRDFRRNQHENLSSLLRLVGSGDKLSLPLPDGEIICPGKAEGVLVGGNLNLLCHLLGTSFIPAPKGKILFIEEKGEPLYRVDRMLTHLKLSGFLRKCAGIVFGEFMECGDDSSLTQVLQDRTLDLDVPVVTGLRAGHGEENVTLPIGVRASLDTENMSLDILEACVRA
jgi:muramoyltetrapeptide carboxypeptidase